MDNRFSEELRRNRVAFVQQLDAESILPHMIQERVFNSYSEESIRSQQTRSRAAAAFLDLVVRRGPNARQAFLNALRSTGQDYLANLIDPRENPDFEFFRNEDRRLATFRDWPKSSPTPLSLARNGLFYTGREDRVRCAYCKGILHTWEPDDSPEYEHRRHFPQCTFANPTVNHQTLIASLNNGANAECMSELKSCKICMDAEISTTFIPCGHFISCERCSVRFKQCPICRTQVSGTVKTFVS